MAARRSFPRRRHCGRTELHGLDELYDLENDSGEIRNRIADPAAQLVLAELQSEVDRLMEATR